MQEFIEKLIGRLEEREVQAYAKTDGGATYTAYRNAIEIVNQLAEEQKHCIKSSCSNCETYDKENHYCHKWCDVIENTVKEIEENNSNDFCEWTEKSIDGIELVREPHRMKLFHIEEERQFCPYCGKKIKVAPYQPKGE